MIGNKQRFFDPPVKKSIRKTCWNVKKWLLYNKKLIRLFILRKLSQTCWQDKQIWIFLNKLIFTVKLDKDDDAAISFITDKQQKSFL